MKTSELDGLLDRLENAAVQNGRLREKIEQQDSQIAQLQKRVKELESPGPEARLRAGLAEIGQERWTLQTSITERGIFKELWLTDELCRHAGKAVELQLTIKK
jgi:predicted nuclease with TOPRIM domain